MARPTKQGLEYFPLDCDIFCDEKVLSVTVNFGAKGAAVLIALLCAIYRQSYFVQWNETQALKVAHDLPGVTTDLANKIVLDLVKRQFFDKNLFNSAGVLTSAGIQRRWLQCKKNRVDTSTLPHWLVLEAKTPILEAKTPVLEAKTPIKESKVKEKEKNVEKKDDVSAPKSDAKKPPGDDFDTFLTSFFDPNRQATIEQLCMSLHISRSRLEELAREAINEWRLCDCRHDNYTDAANHLINHIRKKLPRNGNYTNSNAATARPANRPEIRSTPARLDPQDNWETGF